MHVVSLGHDTKIFDTTSRPYGRQVAYAKKAGQLSMLIPTLTSYPQVVTEGLMVEAVAANLAPLRFLKLLMRTVRVVSRAKRKEKVVLTVQSPFELGLIGLIVSKCSRVPLEVQVHGDFYSREYWRQESRGNRFRYQLGVFVLRRANRVRVVGERVRTSLVSRKVARERITVLPIQTALTAFLEASPRPLWPDTNRLTIISVARFSREKNLPLLLRAFKSVNQAYPDTQLVLVGEGGEEKKLQAEIATLWPKRTSPVLIYPWQSDVAAVMKAADIFALTSDYEGYAMVLGEAMASGLPIITTDVGCVGELCLPDIHALVVPPRDETALSAALTALVTDTDLRTRMAAAGVATIKTMEQSDEVYTNQIVAGWQQLLT
ncbi:MAG: glycosyltransferase family 4 protein [Candidatus Pacebacteria bacterium]|nr:glycosyltransferase family 4 protein [Candidatus Paceibacterota bacterium]